MENWSGLLMRSGLDFIQTTCMVVIYVCQRNIRLQSQATIDQIFFVQFFCMLLPPLFNICFCQVHTISVLYCAHLCMKCSLGISSFLEEISTLSCSIIFLYFFALITEEGFLTFPCYSLELCIQIGISFLFSFAFCQNMVLPICLQTAYGCFYAITAELSSCNRDCMACKA